MEKEILYNWYNNMQAPYKEQLKTLFNIWCLNIFDKTFELNEDNLYTFMCDYFDFTFKQMENIQICNVYRKISKYYITYISLNNCIHNNNITKRILREIRENI